MTNQQELQYSWQIKRTESYLQILSIFLMLGILHLAMIILGIIIYIYLIFFGKIETGNLLVTNDYIQYWFNDRSDKEVKKYPVFFLGNAIVENRRDIIEYPYEKIECIKMDSSKTRLILVMKNRKRIFIDLKRVPIEKIEEIYAALMSRWAGGN